MFLYLSEKSNDTIKPMTTVTIKEEPEWDASSVDDEEQSIADMFHAEMTVKTEPGEDLDIEENNLVRDTRLSSLGIQTRCSTDSSASFT